MTGLVHVTFCLTHKIIKEEFAKARARIPEGSGIEINEAGQFLKVGAITCFYRTVDPGVMDRLQGMRIHGYTFHDSVRTVDTQLVMWLNQKIAQGTINHEG